MVDHIFLVMCIFMACIVLPTFYFTSGKAFRRVLKTEGLFRTLWKAYTHNLWKWRWNTDVQRRKNEVRRTNEEWGGGWLSMKTARMQIEEWKLMNEEWSLMNEEWWMNTEEWRKRRNDKNEEVTVQILQKWNTFGKCFMCVITFTK